MERKLHGLATVVLAVALVVLVLGAPTGPGWDQTAGHAVLAAHLEHTAAAPLFGAFAGIAAQLPIGEVGFRLALLGAVLGAFTVAGVVAAARALLPRDPLASLFGAGVLLVAPPFREAAAVASPALLAACGAVWALAAAIAHARQPTPRRGAFALAMVGLVIGSAPWLGAALATTLVAWLARAGAGRDRLVLGVGVLGALIVVFWLGAAGRIPGPASSLSAMVAASGQGAAAVVIGSGLLGAAFAAATGLPAARWLALVIALALVHAIVVDPGPTPLLALLAIGMAIIPSAIVRALPASRRELLTVAAGAPLVGAALVTGPALTTEDPGAAPARLATDLIGSLPPGPGVIVATRETPWFAVHYAQALAGARPDLTLAAPAAPTFHDGLVADALRAQRVAGADVPAFGRLEAARAVPRGRGFELRGQASAFAVEVPPPARYASAIGEREAITLALARARYEAGLGRLDAAARAAGLTARFRAADLALLATAMPVRARPALFGFIPRLADHPGDRPIGTWTLELFGDDLAWVAGIEQPELIDPPPARQLHALWRDLLAGSRSADDPEIAALGPTAVAATAEMLATLRPAGH